MIRRTSRALLTTAAAAFALAGVRAIAQQPAPSLVWAPRPVVLPKYTAPMKPHVRLADLKARHKGEAAWRELLVDDGHSRAEYVAEAAGTRVSKRFHPDTRQWFTVVEGEIRVDIEGQTPFTATRGSVVQIPKQNVYALETVGTAPSLRFEVNVASVKTLFPTEVQPPALPGVKWVQALYTRRPAPYENGNQPHVNMYEAARGAQRYTGGRVIRDEHFEGLLIYGYEKDLPPLSPTDRGHFHPESAEFWLVMAGQIRYDIEGVPVFVADEGDVAYVPPSTYHLARFAGPGPSCRFSITEFANNSQLREPEPER
jgi:quercetin dioxygenase-like cupin family protein